MCSYISGIMRYKLNLANICLKYFFILLLDLNRTIEYNIKIQPIIYAIVSNYSFILNWASIKQAKEEEILELMRDNET